MRFDIAQWLRGWWLDILVIIVIFSYAFLRWVFITFTIESDCITANTGYFGLLETKLYYDRICTVCASQGALYRPFRAYKVYIDTNSGTSSSSDIILTFKRSDFDKLFKYAKTDVSEKTRLSYSPKRLNVLAFSLLFSSTLSGVILFSTLIIQASRIVGRELEERFFFTVNEYMKRLAIRLPRYVVVFAMVIILSWLYSFLVNLFRHWSFSVTRRGDKFIIRSGVVSKRAHVISADKINYVDIQQSFLMKIFNICSVHIHCSGYGKGRREIAVLIPITTFSEVESSLKLLMPDTPIPELEMRPRLKNIMRFLWPPIWISFGIPIADFILRTLFPNWHEVIRFCAIMFEIPAVWLIMVKIASAFTTGTGKGGNYLSLCYCKVYQFHNVIVRLDKISKVTYFQTPFQKLKRNCNLKFYTHGESVTCHTVKNFPLDAAESFINKCELGEKHGI